MNAYLLPNVIKYRDYKNLDYTIFNQKLCKEIKKLSLSKLNLLAAKKLFMEILSKLAL